MDGEPVSPLRVLLPAGPLPQDGRRIAFKATPEDCARLAAALQVDRLTAMGANLMARPFRKDGARVTGRFSAVVVQKSVVTLEPVEQRIDEPFEATFLREARAPRRQVEAEPTEIVIDPEAEDPPEPFVGDRIDLGPRLYEALALGTDVGSSSVEALAHGGLGLLLHRNGSTRDGMEHFRQALERSRYRVEPRVETVLTAMMAVCQAELGDRDEAQRFSDRLLGCMSEADDRWIDAAGTLSMAWIDAELCNWDEPSEERFNTALLRFDGAEDVPLVVRALGEAAIRRHRAATFR